MARIGGKNREPRVKLEKGAYKRAMRVFKYVRPHRTTFFIGLFFLFLSSIATMGFPFLLGALLGAGDKTSTSNEVDWSNLDNINNILLLLFGVFLANAIFSYLRITLFSIVTENTLRDIRNKAFEKLIHSPISFFDKQKVGELTSRIATDTNSLQELLMTNLAEFIRQIITICCSLIFIFYLEPKLALIMLAVVPVVAVGAVIFGKFIKKMSKQAQDAAAESNSILEEALIGIKNVKSFANEQFEMIRFGRKTETIKDLSIKGARWRGIFAAFIIVGMFGSITFIIWNGVGMVQQGAINSQEFNQFIMFTIFLGASFAGVGSLMGSIQKSIGATERLMDILAMTPEEVTDHGKDELKLKGHVQFQNVNFSYPSRSEVQVLNGVNMEALPGETIALVGTSGAGKSTIASLLLRFYDTSSGSILFDSVDSTSLAMSDLRSQMAMVPQEVILFGGTIRENIAYGKPGASEEEISRAAEQANALNFINSFPDGLNTMVGDRGIQLSGGQKQRIAIARAVLKNPSILILDEATSSLDSESEKAVQDALDKLMQGRTSFVIAHRLSTIKKADKILVLKNGRIIERGTHDELLKKAGTYAELSNLQLS